MVDKIAHQFPLLQSDEDSRVGHARDRQRWALSMRCPLITTQQSTELQMTRTNNNNNNSLSNDGNVVLKKLNDLSLPHDDKTKKKQQPAVRSITHPLHTHTPPSMTHQGSSLEKASWQQQRQQPSPEHPTCCAFVPALAGAPFLPGSPDLLNNNNHSATMTMIRRFPMPMFSPIAGNATEFRFDNKLVVPTLSPEETMPLDNDESPTTSTLQPPPLMPLSSELLLPPKRALKMRKVDPMLFQKY